MTAIDRDSGTLGALRDAVVSLASARFEKFYVHSTGTHIIKQLEGTEFVANGIRGYGDFADDAYNAYVGALRAYVERQEEVRLRVHEKTLAGVAALGARKVELQVQMPDLLAEQVKGRALAMNVSVGTYIDVLIDSVLPFDLDELQITNWAKAFGRSSKVESFDSVSTFRSVVTLPVAVKRYERLERITGRLAATSQHMTVNDVLIGVIRADAPVPGVVMAQTG